MYLSVNNKRQIALSVHILILYVLYMIDYKMIITLKTEPFIYLFFYLLIFLVLIWLTLFLDKIFCFFFHEDGYTGEKTVLDKNADILENMFLPNVLLNFIDFLTFGAARSFWNTFYFF